MAPRRPHVRRIHGTETPDPWYWLRDRDDPATIAYLEAENAWADSVLSPQAGLRERIFSEIRDRTQETDMSVPVAKDGWWYAVRTEEGRQYPIHVRSRDLDGAPGPEEQVILDENVLAEGHEYFSLGSMAVSPDHRLVAYTVDTAGSERYELRIRDLESGRDLPDRLEGLGYGLAWSADSSVVFCTLVDEAWRPDRVVRHRIGNVTNPDSPEVILTERDERFWLDVGTTLSDEWIVITSGSKMTTEVHVIEASAPDAPPRLIEPRRHGHEYHVEHQGDRFVIMTNDDAPDFRLVEAPLHDSGMDNWTELIAHEPGARLENVEPFAGHMVITRMRAGVPQMTIWDLSDDSRRRIEFDEEVYDAGAGANVEYHSTTFRFSHTSMVSPPSVWSIDMDTMDRELLKRQPVLGDFDSGDYVTERRWATAPDGTEVPISTVRRRDTPLDGTAPALLYGYGAYEVSLPAGFSIPRLSLLDRGFVFAMAHVRGGGEMGRRWYEEGRLARKINTFTDFIACARHLVAEEVCHPDRLVIRGGSAGGLLIGAVLNMAPELFRAAVAEVPFVDVVNTMLDPTIPLTVAEYEEWGDPADPEVYRYMMEWSPYENVHPADYPAMLVTAGLNDPRVQYWEPAKWVAKLRDVGHGDRELVLHTEMGAGHRGPSGRYDAWRDEARVLAFAVSAVSAVSPDGASGAEGPASPAGASGG